MLKEVLNDALHNLHAESGALTSSAIVSLTACRLSAYWNGTSIQTASARFLRHCCPCAAKPPACSLAAISIK